VAALPTMPIAVGSSIVSIGGARGRLVRREDSPANALGVFYGVALKEPSAAAGVDALGTPVFRPTHHLHRKPEKVKEGDNEEPTHSGRRSETAAIHSHPQRHEQALRHDSKSNRCSWTCRCYHAASINRRRDTLPSITLQCKG
jgi:hypothetical protein